MYEIRLYLVNKYNLFICKRYQYEKYLLNYFIMILKNVRILYKLNIYF